MAAAGSSGNRPVAGRRRLLRRRFHGSSLLQGRNCLRDRRRKFRGSGSHELRQVRGARRHRRARELAVEHHVAVFDRPDQGNSQHPDLAGRQRLRSPRRNASRGDFLPLFGYAANSSACPRASMFIFIGALPRTDWLADVVERDDRGFILTGPDLIRDGQRPKGWALDRDPFLLETNVPGTLCRRRCAAWFGETRCFRRRRRIGGRSVHPSIFEQGINGRKFRLASRPGLRRSPRRPDHLVPRATPRNCIPRRATRIFAKAILRTRCS